MIGMVKRMTVRLTRSGTWALAAAGMALTPVATQAQVRTVDPNTAIDADLAPVPQSNSTPTDPGVDGSVPPSSAATQGASPPATDNSTATGAPVTASSPPAALSPAESYQEDDLIGAAEGVFGKGAEGLAGMIEKILKDQGRPNAYIAGRRSFDRFRRGRQCRQHLRARL
jgi:hypothetical protein